MFTVHTQEMLDKAPQLPADIQWHFIGHLQSNKVKAVVGTAHVMLSCAASYYEQAWLFIHQLDFKHLCIDMQQASKPDQLSIAAESVPNLAMVETVDSTKVSV